MLVFGIPLYISRSHFDVPASPFVCTVLTTKAAKATKKILLIEILFATFAIFARFAVKDHEPNRKVRPWKRELPWSFLTVIP
jgi:hypothetical protein